jgi:hypothetical protein
LVSFLTERYINEPQLESINEQEEGGAAEAGADAAGDFQNPSSKRQGNIWDH